MAEFTATYTEGGGEIDPDVETYTCPATVLVRDVVYLTGSGTVDQARADSVATMPIVGVVSSKPTTTTCVVKVFDSVAGFSGLTTDAFYYVSPSTAGGITSTAPTTGGLVVQQVGFARSATTLVVMLGTPVTL